MQLHRHIANDRIPALKARGMGPFVRCALEGRDTTG